MIKKMKFHLIVFFTFGVSLKKWADLGLLDREVQIYKKMISQGNRVTFFTYGDEGDFKFREELGGIDVIPAYAFVKYHGNWWMRFLRTLLFPLTFRALYKTSDIFKTNQMNGSWVPAMAAVLFQKPLVVRCGFEMLHNLVREEKLSLQLAMKTFLGYLVEFFAYGVAKKIVVSNSGSRRFISKFFPFKKKIVLIGNYIDTDLFSKKEPKSKIKENIVLFIGRLNRIKNLENLIKSLAGTGLALDIIGKGEEKEKLVRVAGEFNVNVNFRGVIKNCFLAEEINRYQVVVLPSIFENNPKVLLEAMSCERAVIGSDVDGINEIITTDVNGMLCWLDADSIQKAIKDVFALPLEEKNRIGENARDYIVKNHSFDTIFKKEIRIYNQLINDR